MFYSIVLTLHNLNRWLVLIVGVWTTWQVLRGWVSRQPWQTQYTSGLRVLAWLLTLQFLLGLLLYLLPGGLIQSILQNIPWAQIMKDRLLRFFTLEHPVQMLVAIGLAHTALATARRVKDERRRYGWTAILLLLAILLILAAVPWPGLYYGRPWLRVSW